MSKINIHDNHKNPGIKRAYFRLPVKRDQIDGWCKVELCIPDDDDYRALLSDVLDMLSTWTFYDRSEDKGAARVARVWRAIRRATDLKGQCGDDCSGGDDCPDMDCDDCEGCEDDCDDCEGCE